MVIKSVKLNMSRFVIFLNALFVLFVGATRMCWAMGDGRSASRWNYNVVSIYLCTLLPCAVWFEQVNSNFELFELFSGISSYSVVFRAQQHQPESPTASLYQMPFDACYNSVHWNSFSIFHSSVGSPGIVTCNWKLLALSNEIFTFLYWMITRNAEEEMVGRERGRVSFTLTSVRDLSRFNINRILWNSLENYPWKDAARWHLVNSNDLPIQFIAGQFIFQFNCVTINH